MNVGVCVYTILSNIAALNNRIYPDVAPQGAVQPFCIYRVLDTTFHTSKQETTGTGEVRKYSIRVSIYAPVRVTCENITNDIFTLFKSINKENITGGGLVQCIARIENKSDFIDSTEIQAAAIHSDFDFWLQNN